MNNYNESVYEMTKERSTSIILSNFNLDYILDVVEDNSRRRVEGYSSHLPNIIAALESNYMAMYSTEVIESDYKESLEVDRRNTYEKIILVLCNRNNASHADLSDYGDLYPIAHFLYDFLVTNFRNYLVTFISNYLCFSKMDIYKSFNLAEKKKDKDSSTMYGKKLMSDQYIAAINANLDEIIDGICAHDISFDNILKTIYTPEQAALITSVMEPEADFYKTVYVPILQDSSKRQLIMTDVRFQLVKMGGSNDPRAEFVNIMEGVE